MRLAASICSLAMAGAILVISAAGTALSEGERARRRSPKQDQKAPAKPPVFVPLRIVVPVESYSSRDLLCPAGDKQFASCLQGDQGGAVRLSSPASPLAPLGTSTLQAPSVQAGPWTPPAAGAGSATTVVVSTLPPLPGPTRTIVVRRENPLLWARSPKAEAGPALAALVAAADQLEAPPIGKAATSP